MPSMLPLRVAAILLTLVLANSTSCTSNAHGERTSDVSPSVSMQARCEGPNTIGATKRWNATVSVATRNASQGRAAFAVALPSKWWIGDHVPLGFGRGSFGTSIESQFDAWRNHVLKQTVAGGPFLVIDDEPGEALNGSKSFSMTLTSTVGSRDPYSGSDWTVEVGFFQASGASATGLTTVRCDR